MCKQDTCKKETRTQNCQKMEDQASTLKASLPSSLNRAMALASEKGASSWLTTLPIEEHGFTLHKGAFHDALALRYDWNPSQTPTNCACGKSFTIDHAFTCPKGKSPKRAAKYSLLHCYRKKPSVNFNCAHAHSVPRV